MEKILKRHSFGESVEHTAPFTISWARKLNGKDFNIHHPFGRHHHSATTIITINNHHHQQQIFTDQWQNCIHPIGPLISATNLLISAKRHHSSIINGGRSTPINEIFTLTVADLHRFCPIDGDGNGIFGVEEDGEANRYRICRSEAAMKRIRRL